jgi:hypothetical protein
VGRRWARRVSLNRRSKSRIVVSIVSNKHNLVPND